MSMIASMMGKNWFSDKLYGLLAALDEVIYGLFAAVIEGMMNIAGTQIFKDGLLNAVTQRIYVILGIYMLFKLAFSLLSSVVNPEHLNDKERGASKIITRSVISVMLLILVPTIFDEMMDAQEKLAVMIPAIIVGEGNFNSATIGNSLASTTMGAFLSSNSNCNQGSEVPENVDDFSKKVTKGCDGKKGTYKHNYTWFFSGVTGIALSILMIFYSVDVAIRSIKLGILQVLAPIPIVSYIDPKSSKDGAFNNWVKETIATYLELFIKLALFYFVLLVLQHITGGLEFPQGISGLAKGYVTIFIIIGAFVFMNGALPFIYKLLGVKRHGSVGLSTLAATVGAMGGGLKAMGAAGLSAMTDSREALAQDKPIGGGYQKGKTIAANFKGNEKSLTMTQRLQNAAMAKRAAKLGVTDKTLDEAKKARDNANARYSTATRLYEQAVASGENSMINWDGQNYTIESFAALMEDGPNSLSAQAKKASKAYDDMDAYGRQMHVGKSVETYRDKYKAEQKAVKKAQDNGTTYRNKYDYSDPDTAKSFATPEARVIPGSSRMPTPEPMSNPAPGPSRTSVPNSTTIDNDIDDAYNAMMNAQINLEENKKADWSNQTYDDSYIRGTTDVTPNNDDANYENMMEDIFDQQRNSNDDYDV